MRGCVRACVRACVRVCVCVCWGEGVSEITSIFHGCSPLMFGPAFVLIAATRARAYMYIRKYILYHCSLSFNDFTNPSGVVGWCDGAG